MCDPKYGDNIHAPNVCLYDPKYALAREARPPKCDCHRPMELHYYKPFASNKENTDFLIVPDWYKKDSSLSCEMCVHSCGHFSVWVCPDKTCPAANELIKHKQILAICVNCVSKNGIITCGVCQDEVYKEYARPCGICESPLCFTCYEEWSKMCQRAQMTKAPVVTCPFCRGNINAYGLTDRQKTRDDTNTVASKKHTVQYDEGPVDLATLRRRARLTQLDAAISYRLDGHY